MRINKQVVTHAAIAAAFSAGFNSDWLKGKVAQLKSQVDTGGMRPYVPWIIAAAAAWYVAKAVR